MSDEHRESARAFGEREIAGSAAARDRASRWDGELFRRMGEAGLLGAAAPRSYGGSDLAALDVSRLQSGFAEGAGDAGLALAWAAHAFGCGVAITHHGAEAQRRHYLPPLARGERIGAVAHREPRTSGDPIGVRTRAVRRGGGWVLEGDKTWVVNGPVADVFVVTAVTAPDRGAAGISAFLVDKGAPGIQVGRRIETTGMRTAMISDIVLRGCEIPGDAMIGAEGTGLTHVARTTQRWERARNIVPFLGFMGRLLAESVAHARSRFQLGKPVGCSQSIRAKLSDMKIRLALSERMAARSAAHLDERGSLGDRDIATSALFLTNAVGEMTRDALAVQGPEGVEAGGLLERLCRDACVLAQLGEGTDVLRSVIAGSLLHLG